MQNISFSGTWDDLLAGLQTLTPEQLAGAINACTEDRTFMDVGLEITTEAQFYCDNEWQGGESNLDAEEQASCDCSRPAGDVYLSLG